MGWEGEVAGEEEGEDHHGDAGELEEKGAAGDGPMHEQEHQGNNRQQQGGNAPPESRLKHDDELPKGTHQHQNAAQNDKDEDERGIHG